MDHQNTPQRQYWLMHSSTEVALIKSKDAEVGDQNEPTYYRGRRVWVDDEYSASLPPVLCEGDPPADFHAYRDKRQAWQGPRATRWQANHTPAV